MRTLTVVGRKKRGKTTLVEQLIPEFKTRGYRVGSIKHTSGEHIFDVPGKDSFRHAQAGADCTLILSTSRLAFFSNRRPEVDERELLDLLFRGYDLIIGEGFKESTYPKIEVMDSSRDRKPLCAAQDKLMAVVCTGHIDSSIPVFSPNQIKELVDFLEEKVLEKKESGDELNL
jgi:molybdopterin-guanine dinucleotide biosynthesis protein MobB